MCMADPPDPFSLQGSARETITHTFTPPYIRQSQLAVRMPIDTHILTLAHV